ncbi:MULTISPECIES: SIS domain-containing protein [Mesorhizobium]|uniref:Glutamine--fructose-6-phosphate aminotransferase [isomerizing] n=2 Tax=Mesorhizobium TaxID=68287 RepID=A0A1A5JP25_RHILI|nr:MULTISPECIES: SIS domain-containing protein [Mesorhizobium]MBE1707120.1 SIS domain-containing protein [Mesorhizobium japonicum]MBE1715981.1 SIS domain-containing protein [Mesorhizobium japonicum]MUT20659.1 SIS domain-containing protein [Mesorhizobium japonicum]MUT28115.1 SIS domain-containing protein [Mesorhizobium japonicum]OBP81005.1 aminotransferase [Mesorhizobium loti]
MTMTATRSRPVGLAAIDREMARQHADARASFEHNTAMAAEVAASIRKTGRLLLLGMGGSHAVGRAVEPLYRAHGIDALALPLSEQLGQPVPLDGKTVLVTSQSGESAEVVRWFAEAGSVAEVFGLTLEGGSLLARTAPCLVGAGGTELAFAATRSLTVTFALHLAILAALGEDPSAALGALDQKQDNDIMQALAALAEVTTIVTSGRRLQGVAEALALGLTELSRLPCFSLEGGQLRHGPMEMLGPRIGVILFRGNDPTAGLVTAMALSVVEAGAPLVIFDASGQSPVAGAVTLSFKPATGLAAIFAMLPVAQRLMIAFADSRVDNAGTPVRSTKITRSE